MINLTRHEQLASKQNLTLKSQSPGTFRAVWRKFNLSSPATRAFLVVQSWTIFYQHRKMWISSHVSSVNYGKVDCEVLIMSPTDNVTAYTKMILLYDTQERNPPVDGHSKKESLMLDSYQPVLSNSQQKSALHCKKLRSPSLLRMIRWRTSEVEDAAELTVCVSTLGSIIYFRRS